MADGPPDKKRRFSPFPDSTVDQMIEGLDFLFREYDAIVPLKISKSNADYSVPFSRASCSSERCPEKFYFASFFQSTIKKAAQIIMGDASDMSELDSELFRSLFTVLEKSQDIAQRLQKKNHKDKEKAYTVQLAHHLLGPLSVYKDYTLNDHAYKGVCYKEKKTGEFGDTSMGNERVWHGSPDILIGKKPDSIVPVVVSVGEEEEEEGDGPISSLEQCRHQLIAETIVFGLLRYKMNPAAKNSLTPTIAISERDVKIYFYDACHDFLLESSELPLFNDKDLQVSTVLILWLTINYHVTCTGLTEAVVETGFTTNFMANFSDEVKDLYKKELKFGNCRKTPNFYSENSTIIHINCADGFSKPFEKSFDCLTDKHYDLIHAESRKITEEKSKIVQKT